MQKDSIERISTSIVVHVASGSINHLVGAFRYDVIFFFFSYEMISKSL